MVVVVVVALEVLVIDVLTNVEIIVVGVLVIDLKFALPASCSVPSEAAVDLSMDVLAGVMLGLLTGIGIEVLADASGNAFALVMTALELPVSTPLEESIG